MTAYERLPPPVTSIRPRVWVVLFLIGAASWAPVIITIGRVL